MIKTAFLSIACVFQLIIQSQAQTGSLTVTTSVAEEVLKDFKSDGRIFLFVSTSRMSQPRKNTWPSHNNMIFATNLKGWNPGKLFTFNSEAQLTKSVDIPLNEIPAGNYTVQVLWVQNREESNINAPGNLYSESVQINLNGEQSVVLPLKIKTEPQELAEHPLLKEVNIKSKVLSKWWKKEKRLKAAVLLPASFYDEPNRKYPVRYNIAGYGGRYTRANSYVQWNKSFLDWWQSDEAPQIINVFLDGEGPFGDCYQLDSDNSGPYGKALTTELIPYIEEQFRGWGTPESRFVDGCSTGGWVSLALQLFYPDFFGGCFSYSADPVDLENFQLINIYRDENAYTNEYGYLRPIVRGNSGEPVVSQKDFIQFENVLGWNDTYTTSGGQFSAFTALYSPKGKDGLPRPLFHPQTGEIDREVAEHWRKYDLKHYVEANWKKLGPKIRGKIWIWMGDMDNFYLNPAMRAFDKMLQKMENPKSDAIIQFSPMSGHCDGYNDRDVLMQINEKWKSYF
ncbi:Putative esterase [Mariniphaga anaerophila]|uniref:Putative esterase n=1 Tax=Mariniphaga anaerophila TaxID=1484053 RepID=A0A1M4WET2_9BACT|nr:alpha/beta hydrolase-fold protein [Mariniphaga anaerophila]SHE79695.1 Putative esterase [Mariniphaga anaerophila]